MSDKLEALLLREQDPFTAQDVLLNVVNKIRFQAFEKALQEFLETLPAPVRRLLFSSAYEFVLMLVCLSIMNIVTIVAIVVVIDIAFRRYFVVVSFI